jgi:TonB family protein
LRHKPVVEQATSFEPAHERVSKPLPANRSGVQSKSTPKPTPVAKSVAPARISAAPEPSSLQKASETRLLTAPAHSAATLKQVAGSVTPGEVLNQVVPDVSSKSRATIRGTVHVAVRVRVDQAGNIGGTDLFSPGPSKYFAEQALQAARRWDFAPAKIDGHAVPSEWLIRFEFTPSNTRARPSQSAP